ncbi:MAG: hypothetical protein HY699_14835 [Deltaproteobacteria bacterium]|nr:hypothetical protein [Deltaproteobacteria bacterium]
MADRLAEGKSAAGAALRVGLIVLTVLLTSGRWTPAGAVCGACAGDCTADCVVTVDELVLGVNIALGNSQVSACPAFDVSGDGEVTVDELVMGVNYALGACPGPPTATPTRSFTPTLTPTRPTPTFTPTRPTPTNTPPRPTFSFTITPTFTATSTPTTKPGAGNLIMRVVNRTGAQATASLHAWMNSSGVANARGLATDFGGQELYGAAESVSVVLPASCAGSPTCTCVNSTCSFVCDQATGKPRCDVLVRNLAPGDYTADIFVTATGQEQYRRVLIVADPATPNTVDWTVFKTVYAVTSANDQGTGTLRNRINAANATDSTARPVLIRFDHDATAFTGGEVNINVTGNLTVTANDTVIDGTNAAGDPSPVQEFKSRLFKTTVNLTGPAKLAINAPNVTLMGLQISRTLGPDSTIVAADLNQVGFGPNSLGSKARTCRLDGGAAARVNADCSGSNPAQGKDCVDAENTGATNFTEAVIVEDSELRYCYDRPAKSQDGFLILRDNWIHNNLRGGPFVQATDTRTPTPVVGGHLKTERNLIEHNGKNCPNAMMCGAPNGTPTPCVPQTGCPGGSDVGCGLDPMQTPIPCIPNPNFSKDPASCGTSATRPEAAQLSAEQSATAQRATELQTDGDVLRNGLQDGIFLQQNAYGQISNEFICGMTTYGTEINFDTGSTQIGVLGTASVFSGYGAFFHTSGSLIGNVNFGSGNSYGKNAFVMNPSRNFALQSSGSYTARLAESNQWEHCGNGSSCVPASILANDVTAASGKVDVDPGQAHRNPGSLTISTGGVLPKVAAEGAIVHITGTGFNAIEGYTGTPAATDCATLKQGNTCTPQVKGTCVEFTDTSGNLIASQPEILGITPTQITLKSPIACSVPIKIRVTRLDTTDPSGKKVVVADFCKN